MTDKTMYLLGVRLLQDLHYEQSRMSQAELQAVDTVCDVLSRFYAQECLGDIDYACGSSNHELQLDSFSDRHLRRIDAYNKGGEQGLVKFIAEGGEVDDDGDE